MAAFPGLVSVLDRRLGLSAAASAPPTAAGWPAPPPIGSLAGWFAGLLLAAGGMLVAGRRLAGAFVVPAGGWEFAALVTAGAVAVIAVEQACRIGAARVAAVLARCGFAAIVLAVGLPHDAAAWTRSPTPLLAVAAAAIAVLGPLLVAPATPRPRTAAPPRQSARADRPRTRRRRTRSGAVPMSGRLSQRQVRYRLDSGAECIRGRIHLEIPAGARSAQGHIGFCPSFGGLPEVHVDTAYDGVEATVAAAEVVPWGVRIECRLAEPAEEPIEIPVDVTARTRS